MSNSTDKFRIETWPKPDGTPWIAVVFADGKKWVPSFEDLYRIIVPICKVEDEKYPYPAKGKGFVKNFLVDACAFMPWPMIQEKYHLPDRSNGQGAQSEAEQPTEFQHTADEEKQPPGPGRELESEPEEPPDFYLPAW
jgi:hypothetical protein